MEVQVISSFPLQHFSDPASPHNVTRAAEPFRQAALNNPSADSFILEGHTIKPIDSTTLSQIKKHIQPLLTREASIQEQNRAILGLLHDALAMQFGTIITNFAFPTASERIELGSRLSGKTLIEVFQNADLASDLLTSSTIAPLIKQAIETALKAVQLKAEVTEEASVVADLAQEAQEASRAATLSFTAVEEAIKAYANKSNASPSDIEYLHNHWFDIGKSTLPENQSHAEKFRTAANRESHGKIPTEDRFVMQGTSINRAPQKFFGLKLDFIFGTPSKEIEENRDSIRSFKNALIKQYGGVIANFAFPDFDKKIALGAHLDTATIQKSFKIADSLKGFFNRHENIQLITDAINKDAEAEKATGNLDTFSHALKRADQNLQVANAQAAKARSLAAQAVISFADQSVKEGKTTSTSASKLKSIWYLAAFERYNKSSLPSERILPSLPLATAVASAPPYPNETEWK